MLRDDETLLLLAGVLVLASAFLYAGLIALAGTSMPAIALEAEAVTLAAGEAREWVGPAW